MALAHHDATLNHQWCSGKTKFFGTKQGSHDHIFTSQEFTICFKNNTLTMVATDGRRLAMVEQEIEFPQSHETEFIVPTKAVNELSRLLGDKGEVWHVISVETQSKLLGPIMEAKFKPLVDSVDDLSAAFDTTAGEVDKLKDEFKHFTNQFKNLNKDVINIDHLLTTRLVKKDEEIDTLKDQLSDMTADLAAAEEELRALEQAMASGDHGPATLSRYAEAQARLEQRLSAWSSDLERAQQQLKVRLETLIRDWPVDLRKHVERLTREAARLEDAAALSA